MAFTVRRAYCRSCLKWADTHRVVVYQEWRKALYALGCPDCRVLPCPRLKPIPKAEAPCTN